MRLPNGIAVAVLALPLLCLPVLAASLEEEIGRSEVRVRAGAFPLFAGGTVSGTGLVERLEHLGYTRVRGRRPAEPGEYFYGLDTFWIYRRAHRLGGRDHPAELLGLELDGKGERILAAKRPDGTAYPLSTGERWLDPELLAESLAADRSPRQPVRLDSVPERLWRALLAAEDARFFEHGGVDVKSLGRAALANVKAGGVTQGGSTITQQLIKNRELTPRRTMGRKLSEAARALILEARFDKEEILEAYLNQVYLGHVDGLAIHGIGAAARVYFSKEVGELSLAESALLVGMIQGPNRLTPLRHPERARERRDWVLGRMEELGWIDPTEAARARRAKIALRPSSPPRPLARHLIDWVAERTRAEAPRRLDRGRGVVVETTLDPWLQRHAEQVVEVGLARLRRDHRRLREAPLSASLVALDVRSGDVLAYVGGDPGQRDAFDRARKARRQPGSTVKPFVLLQALERCDGYEKLTAATRVADAPLSVGLPQGTWNPANFDGRFRGPVAVRDALARSINVPFVRIARTCGLAGTARRFRAAGLDVPESLPPSFVLGSIETSPLELASAFTVFGRRGRRMEPRPITRIERPEGRRIEAIRSDADRVAREATAFIVRDLLRETVVSGTARSVALDDTEVVAKTGTSSGLKDAWLAGQAGSVVTVVWVGRDDGKPLALTGARAAGPLWRRFVERAAAARPPAPVRRPATVETHFVDPQSGLRVRANHGSARPELFVSGTEPRAERWWRRDREMPVLR